MSKVKSAIKRPGDQKKTLLSLGLKKINSSVERDMDDSLQGMLRVVNHLVNIEEV